MTNIPKYPIIPANTSKAATTFVECSDSINRRNRADTNPVLFKTKKGEFSYCLERVLNYTTQVNICDRLVKIDYQYIKTISWYLGNGRETD